MSTWRASVLKTSNKTQSVIVGEAQNLGIAVRFFVAPIYRGSSRMTHVEVMLEARKSYLKKQGDLHPPALMGFCTWGYIPQTPLHSPG